MSLELAGLPQVSQDGQYMFFTDKTGAFDAIENVGGWGDPNVELNQSALLVYMYRMSDPKEILVTVTGLVKHNPAALNSDEFVYQSDYLQDGYHQFNSVRLMVSANDTDSIDTIPIVFTEGDYWYSSVTAEVKQLVGGQPIVQSLTDPDVLDAIGLSSSTIFLLCERMIFKNLAVEKNNQYTTGRDSRRNNNTEQLREARESQIDIILGVTTAEYQFTFGFKDQAHDTIDSLLDDFNLN